MEVGVDDEQRKITSNRSKSTSSNCCKNVNIPDVDRGWANDVSALSLVEIWVEDHTLLRGTMGNDHEGRKSDVSPFYRCW